MIFFAERDRDRESLHFHWNMFYVARSVFPSFSPSLSPFALTSGTNIVWQGPAVLFFVELLPCWNDPTPHILWLLLKSRGALFPKNVDGMTQELRQRAREKRRRVGGREWGGGGRQTDRCGDLRAKCLSHLLIQKTLHTSGQEEISINSFAFFSPETFWYL